MVYLAIGADIFSDGLMTAIPRRDSLARCQTPQGFRLSVIRRAYQLADADPGFGELPATDDCGIVLRYLPPGVAVGAPGVYWSVSTYPFPGAYASQDTQYQPEYDPL